MIRLTQMKNKIVFTLLYLGVLVFSSCGVDRSHEYYDLIKEDVFIEQQMREVYLWNSDIPAKDQLNYFQNRKAFFASLLSKTCLNNKGDRYSYIDTLDVITKKKPRVLSYGMTFNLYTPQNAPKVRVARITQVFESSPASNAGLHRGDWITQVDGEDLSSSNYTKLSGEKEIDLTRSSMQLNAENEPVFTKIDEITMAKPSVVEELPVQCTKVIETGGHKVGYLLLNHFRKKIANDASDEVYDDLIRASVASLASAGVTDMVLDLRYNEGGYLKGAQVLASLLLPNNVMGETLFVLTHNEKYGDKEDKWILDNALAGGIHLNLTKLYVLVSDQTSGAAEALIQALKPYVQVVTLGKKTTGAPVATSSLISSDYPLWVAHPVVAYVKDKNSEMGSQEGMEPNYKLDESLFVESFVALGDAQEILLRNALGLITTGALVDAETTQNNARAMQVKRVQPKTRCLTK